MKYVGCDPGLHGGCAVIDDVSRTAAAIPMPVSGGEVDSAALADWIRSLGGDCVAAVERVSSMPKQGVASTFKFGTGWGMVRGVLATLRVSTLLVTPQAWKKVVLAGTQKDKDAAISWCRQAYPSVNLVLERCRVPHDGLADALAIAEFLRLRNKSGDASSCS
jgi:crossover junction endodeoxyribonuclease RuvC